MHDHALQPALRNEVYEHHGKSNRGFLEVVVRDTPHLKGAAVGAAVLRLLEVPEATEAARNPECFFHGWVRNHGGGDVPGRRDLNYFVRKEAAMESENLRWVGLAILVAVAGGVLWLQRRESEAKPSRERATSPSLPKPRPMPIRLAVAVFAGKLPAGELDVANVADLVARATYWWVGTADSWSRTGGDGTFQPLNGPATSDDALIVLLVDVLDAAGRAPTSRPEASSQLRAAASRGDAKILGRYTVIDATALTAEGFRR
jgi:hypothetical protein